MSIHFQLWKEVLILNSIQEAFALKFILNFQTCRASQQADVPMALIWPRLYASNLQHILVRSSVGHYNWEQHHEILSDQRFSHFWQIFHAEFWGCLWFFFPPFCMRELDPAKWCIDRSLTHNKNCWKKKSLFTKLKHISAHLKNYNKPSFTE